MVPIPYMVYDLCDHMDGYSSNTFYTKQRVLRLCSKTTHVHGDEPGTGGGVVSGTHGGVCEPIGHSSKVRVEGSEVVRHLDRFWMNDRNTVGEAVFVRDVSLPDAPVDGHPLPGSARSATAAGASRVLSDASPDASLAAPGAVLAFVAPAAAPTAESVVAETAPTWGRAFAIAGAEEAAGLGPEDPLADIAAAAVLAWFAYKMWTYAPPAPAPQTGPAPQRETQKPPSDQRAPEPEPRPPPLPLPPVRISKDPKCRSETICFDKTESPRQDLPHKFDDQLRMQQDALNAKTPAQVVASIPQNGTVGALRAQARPAQNATRSQFIQQHSQSYITQHGAAAWDSYLGSLNAIHRLDMVAGGNPRDIVGMGDATANRGIGREWPVDSRRGELRRYAAEMAEKNCPMAVVLAVC